MTADVVIGADGVYGHVREHILGVDHPSAVKPNFSGFWDARSLIPMQKAKELLGEEYFIVQQQYGWIGEGAFLMHDVLDNKETVQCVLSDFVPDNWNVEEVKSGRKLSREDMEGLTELWTDTPIKKGIIEAMLQNPDHKAYPQWHHKVDAPTYAKGHVCMMGDAAHCMTPWQGSGAASAIEDAMILETVLKAVNDPSLITAALKAYDHVRRPRTQRIVSSSYGTGVIMCGRGLDTGLDIDRIRTALPPRWGFIYGQDHKEHKREALEMMRSFG